MGNYKWKAGVEKCIWRRGIVHNSAHIGVNVFLSESYKLLNKLLRVRCEKITWLRTNKFSVAQLHTHTHPYRKWSWKEKDAGWMYAKKPKRTHEHVNNNKKWSCVFYLPSFRLLIRTYAAHYFVACLDSSFRFTFSTVLLHRFLLLLFRLLLWKVFYFVGSLLLLLLRIKFRSTPCLWVWSQWPTTTGLLHIIPNLHFERLFLRSDWGQHRTFMCAWIYMFIFIFIFI